MFKQNLFFSACLVLALPFFQLSEAHAQGDSRSDWIREKREVPRASDASFDKRLPPVLPGEEVSDGQQKMKVWSTSGPVEVGAAPEAPGSANAAGANSGVVNPSGIAVIVDDRNANRRNK